MAARLATCTSSPQKDGEVEYFDRGYERKSLLLPRAIKSAIGNQGRTNRFCAFFNLLGEFQMFLAYEIHGNNLERPGTS